MSVMYAHSDTDCPLPGAHHLRTHVRIHAFTLDVPFLPAASAFPRVKPGEGGPCLRAHPGRPRTRGHGDGLAWGVHGGRGRVGECMCRAVEGGRAIPIGGRYVRGGFYFIHVFFRYILIAYRSGPREQREYQHRQVRIYASYLPWVTMNQSPSCPSDSVYKVQGSDHEQVVSLAPDAYWSCL